MLRRASTCWLTDQLMVSKEQMWHGALWQNRQNEGLWPAKWGSDLRRHNLWNLCLPAGDTSPAEAFDQCAAPTAVPPRHPPSPTLPSLYHCCLTDLRYSGTSLHTDPMHLSPPHRLLRSEATFKTIIDNSKLSPLVHTTLSPLRFLGQAATTEWKTIDRKCTTGIQFFFIRFVQCACLELHIQGRSVQHPQREWQESVKPVVSVHFTSFQGNNCAITIALHPQHTHCFTLIYFLCPSFVAFAPC